MIELREEEKRRKEKEIEEEKERERREKELQMKREAEEKIKEMVSTRMCMCHVYTPCSVVCSWFPSAFFCNRRNVSEVLEKSWRS